MKHTIQNTKTKEVLTVSDREFRRIKDNPLYVVFEEEKAPDGAPSAVSTDAGELAAPSGADTQAAPEPVTAEADATPLETPAEAEAAPVEAVPTRKKAR